jgi:hypothetical protein
MPRCFPPGRHLLRLFAPGDGNPVSGGAVSARNFACRSICSLVGILTMRETLSGSSGSIDERVSAEFHS